MLSKLTSFFSLSLWRRHVRDAVDTTPAIRTASRATETPTVAAYSTRHQPQRKYALFICSGKETHTRTQRKQTTNYLFSVRLHDARAARGPRAAILGTLSKQTTRNVPRNHRFGEPRIARNKQRRVQTLQRAKGVYHLGSPRRQSTMRRSPCVNNARQGWDCPAPDARTLGPGRVQETRLARNRNNLFPSVQGGELIVHRRGERDCRCSRSRRPRSRREERHGSAGDKPGSLRHKGAPARVGHRSGGTGKVRRARLTVMLAWISNFLAFRPINRQVSSSTDAVTT